MRRHRLFPLLFALIATTSMVVPAFPAPRLQDSPSSGPPLIPAPRLQDSPFPGPPLVPTQGYSYNSAYASYGGNASTVSLLPVVVRHFGDWNSHLAIQNTSNTAADVTVSFYADDSTLVYDISSPVPAYASWYLDAGALDVLGESFRGSAIVTSDAPIQVVDHQVGFGSLAFSGLPATVGPSLSIPALSYDHEGWTSYLAVQNVAPTTETIQVLYSDGISRELSLASGGSHLFYQDMEGHTPGSAFGGLLNSGGPIAATALSIGPFPYTAAYEPFASADTEAILIEVYREFYSWSSQFTILNTGATSTIVDISYTGGYASAREVPPGQVVVVDMEEEPVPSDYTGSAFLTSSSAPIVVSVLAASSMAPGSGDWAQGYAAFPNTLLSQGGTFQPEERDPARDPAGPIGGTTDAAKWVTAGGNSGPGNLAVAQNPPVAGFESNSPVCLGEPMVFTNTTSGSPPISYLWDFGDGTTSTLEHPFHVYAAAGTYTVTLTASNEYGQDTVVAAVEVLPLPAAGFYYAIDGLTVAFTNTSSGASDYFWDFGDGEISTATHPIHTYVAEGTYTVTLCASGLCGIDCVATAVMVMQCEPVQILTATGDVDGCTVTFSAELTGSAPFTYLWDFGDGMTSTAAMPVHIYAASGTYTVTLHVWNCDGAGHDFVSFPVVVDCGPTAYYTYSPLVFKDYTWMGGNWLSVFQVMNIGAADATVTANFFDETGTVYVPMNLGTVPNPFTLAPGARELIVLTLVDELPDGRYATVLAADQSIIAVNYLYGDVPAPALPDLSGSAKEVTPTEVPAGLPVTFTLTLFNGGTGTVTAENVWVEDPLPAGLSYISGSLWASEGTWGYQDGVVQWAGNVSVSHPITISFAATADWGLPDETRLTNTASIQWGYMHVLRSATITVFQECITVSNPLLAYTPTNPTVGEMVTFAGTAEGSLPISFSWSFGDGAGGEGASVTHTYLLGGDYPVTMTATNPCGQELVTDTVSVCAPVSGADLDWTPPTPTVGEQITFTASASGTPPISFSWSFGDGAGGEGASVTHTYLLGGDYPVTMTATNPCGQELVTDTVSICAPVSGAAFGWTPLSPTVGEQITFTASASGTSPISFTWDFGDRVTGTGPLVAHTYSTTGVYTVTLTATNACGESEAVQTLPVAPPEWRIYLPLTFKSHPP